MGTYSRRNRKTSERNAGYRVLHVKRAYTRKGERKSPRVGLHVVQVPFSRSFKGREGERMKLRVMGTADECNLAKGYYSMLERQDNVKYVSVSGLYPNRKGKPFNHKYVFLLTGTPK